MFQGEVLRRHVLIAFLKGGLDPKRAEVKSRLLVPSERHRTFKVGPVTPFKIDFYKDPLGLTIKADGSHPEHIEAVEGWPSWIKPQLRALGAQTEAITALTEQIKLHLEVMKGIGEATKDLKVSTDLLRKTLSREDDGKVSKQEKLKPFSLKEWLREIHERQELT